MAQVEMIYSTQNLMVNVSFTVCMKSALCIHLFVSKQVCTSILKLVLDRFMRDKDLTLESRQLLVWSNESISHGSSQIVTYEASKWDETVPKSYS